MIINAGSLYVSSLASQRLGYWLGSCGSSHSWYYTFPLMRQVPHWTSSCPSISFVCHTKWVFLNPLNRGHRKPGNASLKIRGRKTSKGIFLHVYSRTFVFRRKRVNSDIRLTCLLMQKPEDTIDVIMVWLGVILSRQSSWETKVTVYMMTH